MRLRGFPFGACVAVCMCAGPSFAQDASNPPVEELRGLTIEQLANLEVTSVSRRPEALSGAPAAIDVITHEEVRRSGAQSLPEVLRLARNLEVAQVDSQYYAISARGFNSFQASNKLLVLIDGRSVYTPLYSGVLWDQQQVMLEDIERIEVISGPGGTLWGANAVNGVINVITRSAEETQGWFAQALAGSLDQRVDLRYGGRLGGADGAAFRVYATGLQRGETLTMAGEGDGDDWSLGQVGFRADWGDLQDAFMLQGAYHDRLDSRSDNLGAHVLTRWRRLLRNGSTLEVQAFASHNEAAAGPVSDELQMYDVELQHSFDLGGAHRIVWGGGYRVSDSEFVNAGGASGLIQPSRTLRTSNLFIQDEIALTDTVALTLGLKLEDHTFTGLEYLPNARIAWRPSADSMVWAAVSRAVRTPSRIDRELVSPGVIVPATDFESEDLIAYELGYRTQPLQNVTFSINLYRHEYEGLRTLNLTPTVILPARYANDMDGEIYGAEIWGDLDVSSDWRLSAGVTMLEADLRPASQWALDFNGSGDDPSYQLFLRSSASLNPDWMLDLDVRAIDEIRPDVPAYVEMNARLAWRINEHAELSLAGRNLLDEAHPESFDEGALLQARRSIQVGLGWRY